jgi:hypothetical protein
MEQEKALRELEAGNRNLKQQVQAKLLIKKDFII